MERLPQKMHTIRHTQCYTLKHANNIPRFECFLSLAETNPGFVKRTNGVRIPLLELESRFFPIQLADRRDVSSIFEEISVQSMTSPWPIDFNF